MSNEKLNKYVGYWLLTGCTMILIQVILGGITRLTGSGLSITEWKAILGFIPPLNDTEWQVVFEKYRASSQFALINSSMDLAGFKQIFFWEYFHRLWARSIGVVFIVPFIYFIIKGWLNKKIVPHLVVLFVLGGIQGLVGWLMVSTGLKDRAWVTPFSLTAHLLLATITFAYLVWVYVDLFLQTNSIKVKQTVIFALNFLIFICAFQMMLGGFMAGTHAATFFRTWPLMNGSYIPENVYNTSTSLSNNFLDNAAFIQFAHRNLAYILSIFLLWFWFKNKSSITIKSFVLIPYMLLLQVIMGIITLLFTTDKVPIFWGVAHQSGALILLSLLLITRFRISTNKL
jgi:cytochrome c oxidase assembly protein subunit 15